MKLVKFYNRYKNDVKLKVKEMTSLFNELTIDERKVFLKRLSKTERTAFIKKIRQQAVKDFWYHEREAIINGTCTRDWSPEQIEIIMNIRKKSGKMSENAGKGLVLDEEGGILVDKKGNKAFYGHHMIDVSTHPEYAGDWRNIQALEYNEHYYGAHKEHDTKTPTKGYYDVEEKKTKIIDVTKKDFSFDNLKYPPKKKCIFKSDAEMETTYKDYKKLTDGEKLALKNVDLAISTSDVKRFRSALKLAKKYKSPAFCEKIGLNKDAMIKLLTKAEKTADGKPVYDKGELKNALQAYQIPVASQITKQETEENIKAYHIEIKTGKEYLPLPNEKTQRAKELAAKILDKQKIEETATIYYVGNNTILVTDQHTIPYGNANLETGAINVSDYKSNADLNNEIKSKMNRSGKVSIEEMAFIKEVNQQTAFDKLSKQMAKEQKNAPKVDRSQMSLEEKRKSRAEAKGKFQEAKKDVYILKMELEHELSAVKMRGMDEQSIEKVNSIANRIANATFQMEKSKEKFQNTKETIKESLDSSMNKISQKINKITESMEQKIASGKTALMKIRDEAHKLNTKKEILNTIDKTNFTEIVKNINKNHIKLNHTIDKVMVDTLDKTQTELQSIYQKNAIGKEEQTNEKGFMEKQKVALSDLKNMSLDCKRDMIELQQEFSATKVMPNNIINTEKKQEGTQTKINKVLETPANKNVKDSIDKKSVIQGMSNLNERLEAAKKIGESKKVQVSNLKSKVVKHKDNER